MRVSVLLRSRLLDRIDRRQRGEAADDRPWEALASYPARNRNGTRRPRRSGRPLWPAWQAGISNLFAIDGDQCAGLAASHDRHRSDSAQLGFTTPELLGHHAKLIVVARQDLAPRQPFSSSARSRRGNCIDGS